MKKILPIAVIFVLFAFSSVKFNREKATATVNQVQGMYVFVDSSPSAEYEYLGTVQTNKKAKISNPQYQIVRDYLLMVAKEKYPNADGIVIHFSPADWDKADVIKFK